MNPPLFVRVANKIDELIRPAEIAEELNLTTRQVIEQSFIAVGENLIWESDLFFILSGRYKNVSGIILDAFEKLTLQRFRAALKIEIYPDFYDLDELKLLASLTKRRVHVGDMYVLLTEIERTLHVEIKKALQEKFGEGEAGWWKQGIPETVRIKCAEARERDGRFDAPPYSFTTFIHLKDILEKGNKGKNKNLFAKKLPKATGQIDDFLSGLTSLNGIRNQVMHPVREEPPTEDDFKFVKEMYKKLIRSPWR